MKRVVLKLKGRGLAGANDTEVKTGSECKAMTDCPDKTKPYCDKGNCVECLIDAHCSIGVQTCVNGKCVIKTAPQCH